jgi:hypothetical protein
MKRSHALCFLTLLGSVIYAGTMIPVAWTAGLDTPTPSAPAKIDPDKPTAILVGSPQGAIVITPEMVDKIVRAQTPEYLRSIPGTPAPKSTEMRMRVPAKPGRMQSADAQRSSPIAGSGEAAGR